MCCYGSTRGVDKEADWRRVVWGKHNSYLLLLIVNLTFRHPILPFTQKLDVFINEINQLKSKIQTFSVQKVIKERISNTLNKQISSEHEEPQSEISSYFDCTQARTEQKQKSCDKNRLLQIATFACITLVYSQFVFLIYLTAQSQFRVGVMFLLVCTSYISYLVVKVNIWLSCWPILSDCCAMATQKTRARSQNKSNMKNYAQTFTRTNVLNFPKQDGGYKKELKHSKSTTTYWIITV